MKKNDSKLDDSKIDANISATPLTNQMKRLLHINNRHDSFHEGYNKKNSKLNSIQLSHFMFAHYKNNIQHTRKIDFSIGSHISWHSWFVIQFEVLIAHFKLTFSFVFVGRFKSFYDSRFCCCAWCTPLWLNVYMVLKSFAVAQHSHESILCQHHLCACVNMIVRAFNTINFFTNFDLPVWLVAVAVVAVVV